MEKTIEAIEKFASTISNWETPEDFAGEEPAEERSIKINGEELI